MAIYPCNNLLGCQTLLDWTQVKKELPHLFHDAKPINIQSKNLILYFALQKVAPFHVCIVAYKDQYMLLHGKVELQILLDFILCDTSLERSQWISPHPFPSKKKNLSFWNLPLSHKERILATRIPHCDFCVTAEDELELLQSYYSADASLSMREPML